MSWYKKYLSVYEKPYSEVPESVINTVRDNLRQRQSEKPLVTVSIIAYNEEKHILPCIWSLSDNNSKYDYEIIVINNNSTDATCQILKDINAHYYTEIKKGPGHARNCGLIHAKGKYHVCIDADTIYPPHYIETMTKALKGNSVVCTYGLWRFLPTKGYPRWQLFIYESLRDLFLFIQNIKRPELCVRGMAFAFHTDIGRKIMFRTEIIRGEDGSMALNLKKYGKLKFVTNKKCCVYTSLGTLKNDGSLLNSLWIRIKKGLLNIGSLFTRKEYYEDKEDNLIKK